MQGAGFKVQGLEISGLTEDSTQARACAAVGEAPALHRDVADVGSVGLRSSGLSGFRI